MPQVGHLAPAHARHYRLHLDESGRVADDARDPGSLAFPLRSGLALGDLAGRVARHALPAALHSRLRVDWMVFATFILLWRHASPYRVQAQSLTSDPGRARAQHNVHHGLENPRAVIGLLRKPPGPSAAAES